MCWPTPPLQPPRSFDMSMPFAHFLSPTSMQPNKVHMHSSRVGNEVCKKLIINDDCLPGRPSSGWSVIVDRVQCSSVSASAHTCSLLGPLMWCSLAASAWMASRPSAPSQADLHNT